MYEFIVTPNAFIKVVSAIGVHAKHETSISQYSVGTCNNCLLPIRRRNQPRRASHTHRSSLRSVNHPRHGCCQSGCKSCEMKRASLTLISNVLKSGYKRCELKRATPTLISNLLKSGYKSRKVKRASPTMISNHKMSGYMSRELERTPPTLKSII